MEVVKLLLARSDVAVNLANQVRGSGVAGRERGQVGRAGLHTTVLRRRVAHLNSHEGGVWATEGGHRAAVWQAVGGWGAIGVRCEVRVLKASLTADALVGCTAGRLYAGWMDAAAHGLWQRSRGGGEAAAGAL
jgi:hypothetical protein